MRVIKLMIVLILSVGCSADFTRADAARRISRVLQNRDRNVGSFEAFLASAQKFLETQTRGIHLFNGDTVSLLKQFIAAGKAVQEGDCSENTRHLINSLPYKVGSDYASLRVAIAEFEDEFDTICELQASEKELYSTLDQKKLEKISQITKIAIAILEGDEYFHRAGLDEAASIRYMSKHSDLLNRLVTDDGAKQFKNDLLSYYEKEGKEISIAETIRLHVTEPCLYYIKATSSIFGQKVRDYSVYGL